MGSDKPNSGDGASNSQSERQHGNATPATDSPGTNPLPNAPMPVQEPKSQVAQDVGKSAENGYSERVYRLEVWQHWFTAALVGTAILSGVIATWHGCEMKRQNAIMSRQMGQTDDLIKLSQLSQQSEIALDSYSIENVESGNTPTIKVKLKNTGRSTATIEDYGTAWINRRYTGETLEELTATFRRSHANSLKNADRLKRVFLAPGDPFEFEDTDWSDLRENDRTAPFSISTSARVEYEKEVHRFIVYVFYKDAIRAGRFSQFILRYDPADKSFKPEERGSIVE